MYRVTVSVYLCEYVCVLTKLPGNDGERFSHRRRRRSLIRSLRTHTRLEWPPKDTPNAAVRDTGAAAAGASVIITRYSTMPPPSKGHRPRDDHNNNYLQFVLFGKRTEILKSHKILSKSV